MKIFFFFYTKYNNIKKSNKILFLNNNVLIFEKIKNNKNNNFLKGLNLFKKNGLNLKIINFFCYYWYYFYIKLYTTYNFRKNNDTYKYFNEIKAFINTNSYFKNPIILLNWYINYFKFLISMEFLQNFNFKIKKKKNMIKKNKYTVYFCKKK